MRVMRRVRMIGGGDLQYYGMNSKGCFLYGRRVRVEVKRGECSFVLT